MRSIIIVVVIALALSACTEQSTPESKVGSVSQAVSAAPVFPLSGNCMADHEAVESELYRRVAPWTTSCVSNDDCTIVDLSLSCQSMCPVAISKANAQFAAASRALLETDVC